MSSACPDDPRGVAVRHRIGAPSLPWDEPTSIRGRDAMASRAVPGDRAPDAPSVPAVRSRPRARTSGFARFSRERSARRDEAVRGRLP